MAKKKELNLKNLQEGSIDDILNHLQTYKGKDFDTRIKAFEAFNDPDKELHARIAFHAEYIVQGHPTDKSMPGAYNLAYKVLDEKLKGNYDKLTKDADIYAMMETFVDEMLTQVAGDKFTKAMQEAKKAGLSDKEIRDHKKRMFMKYFRDEHGRSIDPFNLERFKGKTKISAIKSLKEVSKVTLEMYQMHILKKATGHLLDDFDEYDFAPYVAKKYKEAGYEHKKHHLTKDMETLQKEYVTLLQDGNVKELGYKKIKKK